ncbi:hypothetical protein AAHA92_21318 [Salvia divinorum]|uniref:Retrotransposon Copia-like N-terminal domain-containing protein n=1 Tax=Salvia divinorum TaxID=28513 RepID=A0ABD1GK17_SALDI
MSDSDTENSKPSQTETYGRLTSRIPRWHEVDESALVKGHRGEEDDFSHFWRFRPPLSDDPGYSKWQQQDHCCFNWIISNLETSLVNEVSQYKTAKDLWDGLAVTYGSGADPFQVHDLHRQAMSMKQGDMTLEALWNTFQDLWILINARDPNPMDNPKSIEKYNKHTQRHRLYQFV